MELGIIGALIAISGIAVGVLVLPIVIYYEIYWFFYLYPLPIIIWFFLGISSDIMIYYLVKCPKCGHNPTRKRDGGKMNSRMMWGRLKKMESCPSCNYKVGD